MTIRIILKNGSEFSIKCDEFTVKTNEFGVTTGYDIKGITENRPIYLDLGQIAAVVRTLSDETEEKVAEREKKVAFKELKAKCPFCEGANENAIIYANEANKEFFVYCKMCGIETIDTYTSKAKALKAFVEGKTKSINASDMT